MSDKTIGRTARRNGRRENGDIVRCAAWVAFVLLMCAPAPQIATVRGREQFVRQEAAFPVVYDPPVEANSVDPVRYEVLRGDFHMHTVYSDGSLTPTDRVIEAWQYGYDVIAITDHGSVRAYEEARIMAAALGILLLRGVETGISSNEHVVALDFSAGYEPRDAHQWAEIPGQARVFYQDEWRRLVSLGGYALYAHPHVGLREPMLWGIRQGLLLGIEVKNDVVGSGWNTVFSHGTWWYPSAFDWAVDYGLTIFANSDVHGARSDAEQATTLVLAKERSVAGVMEALRAGRTVATFNNMLCAHKWVLDLLMASMVGVRLNRTEDGKVFLRLRNLGPKELTAEVEGIPVESITLGAYQDILVGLRRKPEALTVTWKNLYIRPATNLTTTYLLAGAEP